MGMPFRQFTAEFDDFYQDQFGLRGILLQLWQRLNILLGKSPTDKVLIVARAGCFTRRMTSSETRGTPSFDQYPAGNGASVPGSQRDCLSHSGISYLYVVTPDKHSIYPEYLPASVEVVEVKKPLINLLVICRNTLISTSWTCALRYRKQAGITAFITRQIPTGTLSVPTTVRCVLLTICSLKFPWQAACPR